MRVIRHLVLGIGLLALATACGGGDDSAVAADEAGSDGSEDVSGESEDLSGELLTIEDLDGEWATEGPEEIKASDVVDDNITGPCPGGETVLLPNVEDNLRAPGNASIRFEAVDGTGMVLSEEVSHDPAGELFEAGRQAFDACVGEEWEQSGAPNGAENVKLETLDLADHGDDAVGYRQLWGTGGDYDHQDLMAVVRVGDVSLSLWLIGESIDDPIGGFPEALAAAVAHLEDGERAATVESPSTTTTSEAPGTTETGASEVFLEDLHPGDCFDDSGHGTPEVGEITRVDCGSPHDAEVFGTPSLPGEPGAPYPGDDEIDRLSDELCMGEFASYVGIDFQDSKWEFVYIPPDEETWNKYDDRLVVCSLNDPSFNKIEGSKRGSGT